MNKQNINIVKLRDAAQIPTKGSIEAGGWDVYAAEIQKVYDDLYIVYLGLAMQPPKGFKITLVPRSSITKTRWYLPNSPGLGDAKSIFS
jgi:dUTPase